MKDGLQIGKGLLWVLIWFCFMLLYTALDVALWRKVTPRYGRCLNFACIVACMVAYLRLLTQENNFKVNLFENCSLSGIGLGILCAIGFYFLLDKGLDPLFERMLPESEERYQQTLQSLGAAGVFGLLQTCILAPIIEEILMRAFLLGGLSLSLGKGAALLISSAVFALLHFNMVQTVSAFVCGCVLGLLYLHTGSILCCMIAHMGYNLISYLTMILPLYRKL